MSKAAPSNPQDFSMPLKAFKGGWAARRKKMNNMVDRVNALGDYLARNPIGAAAGTSTVIYVNANGARATMTVLRVGEITIVDAGTG